MRRLGTGLAQLIRHLGEDARGHDCNQESGGNEEEEELQRAHTP